MQSRNDNLRNHVARDRAAVSSLFYFEWVSECEKRKKEDNFEAITNWINIIKTISNEREREIETESQWYNNHGYRQFLTANSIIIKGGAQATNKKEKKRKWSIMPKDISLSLFFFTSQLGCWEYYCLQYNHKASKIMFKPTHARISLTVNKLLPVKMLNCYINDNFCWSKKLSITFNFMFYLHSKLEGSRKSKKWNYR